MIEKYSDVLIIGAGPAGMVAAMGTAMNYMDKSVTVIRENERLLVPCGIPYIFGKTLGSVEKDETECGGHNPIVEKIDRVVDSVIQVDIENKTVYAKNHTLKFDKLIFATGSVPFVHKNFADVLHLPNVFTVDKNFEHLVNMKKKIDASSKVVVVGTGFIGVELASEIASINKEVSIVGGSHILAGAFDKDMAIQAEELMKELGIKLVLGQHAESIVEENGEAVGIKLCDESIIEADVIVFATGYKPNTSLAKEAGLKLARYGGIWVDEYMRTRNKDIFAIGDCSGRRDFITRDPSKVMLASTSSAEARVAVSSLYNISVLKGFNGTIAIFSTMIKERVFASAGITEQSAKEQNIDIVTGYFEGLNRHPGTIPDSAKQSVKLIAMRNSGRVIGGQIVGAKEAGEMINMIGLAIESELTIYSLLTLQVATQPLLTAAPTNYPIVQAAYDALKNSQSYN